MASETEQDEDCRGQATRVQAIHPLPVCLLETKAQRSRCGPEPRREHTNARDITDEDGITWTCIQAFAGLGNDPERADATRVEGSEGKVRVVCTPSGAARSVRVACPADWDTSMQDEQLLSAIEEALAEPEQAT